MFLGTIKSTDYYHANSYKKDIILETAENPVEFVSHEEFDALVDNVHYRAEYLTYCNSMNTIAILIISFLLLVSCSTTQKMYAGYAEVFSASYGDERFDRCDEIIVNTYGVTHFGDTMVIDSKLKYNCKKGIPYTWADQTIDN